ncbi:hypothetical protein OH76DRAFT_1554302 [Lentinus brumalis]|uniref:PH domain-containing protein n=1 Tax=Lentinus brumalis TaxID=2498619 RepID=A0A371DJC7_9APHY|nr:hypothetical protein OH76DRAFT_1554302 [Polyporus brumalis]
MTSYSSSSGEPRSPLFGTATFSTLSPTQTPYSSSRYTYSERSATPIGSNTGSELSSPRQMRWIVVSPSPDSDSETYTDENSLDDVREVEAALSLVEDEIDNTEDALTEWSRGSSSVGTSTSFTGQYSAATSVTPSSYVSEGYRTMTDAILDRERRVLSTISEHTENASRPNSFAQSGSGSRPNTHHSNNSGNRASANLEDRPSPVFHSRAATDPSGALATGRVLNVPGRRAGELIAFFEEKQTTPGRESPRLFGHARTLSAPMGPRSPAPRSPGPRSTSPYTTTMSPSMSTFGHTTSYGYGTTTGYGTSTYGYSSRPSSPTKSRTGSSLSASDPVTTMSSFMSPPARGTTLSSDSRFVPTSTETFTQSRSGPSTYTGPGTSTSGTYSNTFTGFTTTATPTASSLRRPQTSPRSPLTSVRNIVAAWKERTPSLSKSVRSNTTSPSPTQGDGLFSVRRRASRGGARPGDRGVDEIGRSTSTGAQSVADASSGDAFSTSGVLPTFDIAELGQFAGAGGAQEPLRIGLLWYLNVHATPPYRWQRCQALLYPHMLLLSWIAPGGGRGIVTLDLLNCIEVRSVQSPSHPSAQDDVGTIAAIEQSVREDEQVGQWGTTGELGDMSLMETLCPFQLLYSDGIERLGAESPRERVRWVSAIWEVLDRAITIPDRSTSGSPTGSIRTIQSITSTATSQSGTGSRSTIYVPPLDEMSDIQSLSGSSSLSRRQSLASAHHTRATDDAAVSSQGYLYPGDPRVIAPSRSSSLRRTSSMTDLDEEFAEALRRARDGRPGLGFGLGLAGGIAIGDGSPVTISSGPRLGGNVYLSPPPSVGRGSDKKSRSSDTSSSVSDEAFFSARSTPDTRTPTSSFYSTSSLTRALTTTETKTGTGTGTALVTDESIEFASGSGTNIVTSTLSYRGTDSASHLGDSHDSHSGSSRMYSSTSPSRSSLTRSGGVRRRTPRDSRSYSVPSFPTDSEEVSDKENTYSSGTYSYTLSTLESYSRTGTTPTMSRSMSRSRSVTPTPSSNSFTHSLDVPYSRSETQSEPRSPSTASFKSLSTIPSLSDYETALVCETEYETAPKCPSEYARTEFETVPVCTTPAPTEYITAEVCPSDVSTDFRTAECRCKDKVPDSDEISITAPSEMPTIPSSASSPVQREMELDEADIPLPPSSYSPSEPSEHTPTERALSPTTLTPTSATEPSLELTPTSSELDESIIMTPSTIEFTDESPTESIPGPSPIPPMSDMFTELEPTISLTDVSTPTESSITPTPSSQLTPSVPSTVSQPDTPSSPAIPDSAWGQETDQSYESSLLRESPSMASQALPEGPDISFETSFLRPSGTPVSSEESTMLTPNTEVSPSSPVSEVSPTSAELTPTQSSMSLLPDVTTPVPVPRDFPPAVTVTLSRTPSTISAVSSVSMSSSRIAPSEFELDLRTEPSLLSTPSSESVRLSDHPPTRPPSALPLFVPLPPSPSPSTPSASMRLSITTPSGNVPSIASNIETIPSDAPSHILTHDVNRLLQYLNDVNDARGAESKEMASDIQDIKGTLEDLEALLRERMFPDAPPPVPRKDQSVGGSTIISSRSPRYRGEIASERSTPARGREGPRIVRAISLSPPPIRVPLSPDTLSETMSFLSSHHSDDLSLMESESYPMGMDIPASPSWPSSSPISSPEASTSSSPTSAPPSSLTPSEELSDIGLGHLTVPPRRLTASLSPTPPPLSSSPSPSSVSSGTARPMPPISLATLRDNLDGIRQQIASMLDGQDATNRRLDELRDMPRAQPVAAPADRWDEFADRLRLIEDNLLRLLDRARVQPRVDEEAASSVDTETRSLLDRIARAHEDAGREPPTIHAPIPRQAGPSFDEQLMEIMMSGPPPPQGQVQPPPPLIPLVYRPGQRTRPRSVSPVFEGDLPQRPGTFPITRPTFPRETRRPVGTRPPPVRVHRDPRGGPVAPSESDSQTEPPHVIPAPTGAGARPVSGPDIDFEAHVRGHRQQRRPGTDGFFTAQTDQPTRPGTAPPAVDTEPQQSWYQPAPQQPAAAPVPPPGETFGQPQPPQPQFIPVGPGPTVVQLPPAFNDILALLRDNRDGQLASLEQQSEIINYLRGLNQWLERDVHDRHAEIQGVSARLEQTRDEVIPLLNQIAATLRREGTPAGFPGVGFPPPGSVGAGPANIVIPPTVIPPAGGAFPQVPHGFVPFPGPGHVAPDRVRPGGLFPYSRTPSPDHTPVIPPPPHMWGGPQPPVIPPGTYPHPAGPAFPQPQPGTAYPVSRSSSSGFVPPPLSGSSRSSSPRSRSPRSQPDRVTVIPPPGYQTQQGAGGQQPPITIVPPPVGQPATVINIPPSSRPSHGHSRSSSSSPDHEHRPTPSPAEAVAPDEGRVGSPRRSPRREHEEPRREHEYYPEHEHRPSAEGAHPGTTVVLPPGQQAVHDQPHPTASTMGPAHPPTMTSPTPIIIQPPMQYGPQVGFGGPMAPGVPQVLPMSDHHSHRTSPTLHGEHELHRHHSPTPSTRRSSRRTRARSYSRSPSSTHSPHERVIVYPRSHSRSPPPQQPTVVVTPGGVPGTMPGVQPPVVIRQSPSGRHDFSRSPSPIIVRTSPQRTHRSHRSHRSQSASPHRTVIEIPASARSRSPSRRYSPHDPHRRLSRSPRRHDPSYDRDRPDRPSGRRYSPRDDDDGYRRRSRSPYYDDRDRRRPRSRSPRHYDGHERYRPRSRSPRHYDDHDRPRPRRRSRSPRHYDDRDGHRTRSRSPRHYDDRDRHRRSPRHSEGGDRHGRRSRSPRHYEDDDRHGSPRTTRPRSPHHDDYDRPRSSRTHGAPSIPFVVTTGHSRRGSPSRRGSHSRRGSPSHRATDRPPTTLEWGPPEHDDHVRRPHDEYEEGALPAGTLPIREPRTHRNGSDRTQGPRPVTSHDFVESEHDEHEARSRSPSVASDLRHAYTLPHAPTYQHTGPVEIPAESLRDQLRGTDPFVIPVAPSAVHPAPIVAQPTPVVAQPAPTIARHTPIVAPPARDVEAIPSVVHEGPGSAGTLYEGAAPTTVYEAPRSPTRTAPPASHPAHRMEVAYSGPSDVGFADNERERQERFEDLAGRMDDTILDLQEGEEKREYNYRANEDERERLFVESQRRRDEEAIQRRDGVWKELEDRLATLPPVGEPPVFLPPPAPETVQMPVPEVSAGDVPQTLSPAVAMDSDAVSLVETVQRAASLHAEEIKEIVRAEREELQREREAAQAERERAQVEEAAEKARMHEEYQAHIRSLEAELNAVRKELEDEKMARATDEAERRERERAEMLEHSDAMRNQLGDLTNLVTEQRDEMAQKRQLMDERWEVKQNRWEQKDAEDAQTRNMLQQILENQAQMLSEQIQCKNELQEELRSNQRAALDAIEAQRVAYEETIRQMAEGWRADCEQHKQETIDAVKATAHEQVPYNVQGYLEEFSRSLATEVRMLLSEVGKLREDKRNLEYQIGELLQFKSKYGPGGEFDPSWKPAMTCVPTDAAAAQEPAPAPEPEPEVPQPAPSAWRTIHTRGSRRARRSQGAAAPQPPPAEPAPTTQSWATWQPNPAFQPSPPSVTVEHLLAPSQGSPGLFGPRSPRDSLHR